MRRNFWLTIIYGPDKVPCWRYHYTREQAFERIRDKRHIYKNHCIYYNIEEIRAASGDYRVRIEIRKELQDFIQYYEKIMVGRGF